MLIDLIACDQYQLPVRLLLNCLFSLPGGGPTGEQIVCWINYINYWNTTGMLVLSTDVTTPLYS
jgi:hypothetical protein